MEARDATAKGGIVRQNVSQTRFASRVFLLLTSFFFFTLFSQTSQTGDCYGTWEAGLCGASFFSSYSSCGCCTYSGGVSQQGSQQGSQEQQDFTSDYSPKEVIDEDPPPPPPPPPPPTELNVEEIPDDNQQADGVQEERQESKPAEEEEQEPPSSSTISTSERNQTADVPEESPTPVVDDEGGSTNSTQLNDTNTLVLPPGSQTLILELPPESSSLDITMLADALNQGLLSNENVTFLPGEKEGQYIAIVGPSIGNSLVLNVTDLLSMLGPEASVDIDCVGEGCEISRNISNRFRLDGPVVLEASSGRKLLSSELYSTPAEREAEELIEIKLGCGPQVLKTNISDGNKTYGFDIILRGPGIPVECENDTALERFRTDTNMTTPKVQKQTDQTIESSGSEESKANLKLIIPIVVGVVGLALSGLFAAFFVMRRQRRRGSASGIYAPEDGNRDDYAAVISSKLADNQSALGAFGGPESKHDDRSFSTPTKLSENSEILSTLGSARSTPFRSPNFFTPPLEDNNLIQVSNPDRSELSVAEEVDTVKEPQENLNGEILAKGNKKKRKGIKRWFPRNIEADSKGKGKRKMSAEKVLELESQKQKPRNLIDAFTSMPQQQGAQSSPSLFHSPEALNSFKAIQKLIDEDDVDD